MSYDLDALHAKYGINVASVKFGTTAERSSIALIAAVAGAFPVIHQVACAGSVYGFFELSQSTVAGTVNWQGFTGNTPLIEGVRVQMDASAVVNFHASGVGADMGSGFFRVWYSLQKGVGAGLSL